MIEVVQAKNGSPVLIKNGKYLASSFDPQKEAETWWSHCHRLVKHAEGIFVLGLGSGYHIEAIKIHRSDLPLTVIECDKEIVDAIQSRVASNQVEILWETDWRRVYQAPGVSEKVRNNYAVLMHPGSYAVEPEYFSNAHKFLLARSVEGLFALLKNRPELFAELDPAKLADLARSGEPVTIKTLSQLMKPTTFADPNRRLWKVLEELVA